MNSRAIDEKKAEELDNFISSQAILEFLNNFNKLKSKNDFSLGKIIIRKFIELKHHEIGGNSIPKAHEYRFFVLNEKIIDYSFYWNGENPFRIHPSELASIKRMVLKNAKKIKVPYISVDVGETVNDGWKIIEIGDGQFSDIRNISPLKLWNYILKN